VIQIVHRYEASIWIAIHALRTGSTERVST